MSMKKIKDYITEKQKFLIKNKNVLNNYDHYDYHPKTKTELIDIIIKLLEQGKTDLNCIDVSEITDMSLLFHDVTGKVTVKEIDISEWDVSNVKFMGCMFYGCKKFNADLSKWDVSNVQRMDYMFYVCKKFNCDLSKWDVSNVERMQYMFDDCDTLKKNNKIPAWYSN